LLRDELGEVSILLHDETDTLFLTSERFEALQAAAQVYELASKAQSIITEVTQDDPDIAMTFKVGQVLEEVANGELRKHVFATFRAASVSVPSVTAILTVGQAPSLSAADRERIENERKEQAYVSKRRKATARFVSAFIDERALQVQRLLRNQLTTQSMWHIFELIQDDMGGAIKDLVSQNRQTRFERSINHPLAFGQQARRLISKAEPPPKPMGLEEARAFVRDLATRWLEIKASLPPSI
ncbi:MAG TPA: hypothetical protein VKR62_01165, partial [Roseiarcus sp.]|nr:hypothetical protein [Roseiarcus sp.]